MRKIWILWMLCCVMIACKKNDVSFVVSNEKPRAGESVKFTNNSTTGEDWEWKFGDGTTSTLKSPSHVFQKPGAYMVTLKVDKKNAWMASKQLTVVDTVPTFVCSDTAFYIFKDYVFTANVYNPYNYMVTYDWFFPLNMIYATVEDENSTTGTIRLYFTEAVDAPIALNLIMNGDTTFVQKYFKVRDRKTHSLLLRADEGDYRQRIFEARAEMEKPDPTTTALLDAAQDTLQTYNGKEFRLSELQEVFPELEGFHIANRKIYYRADGLWVANIDGANPVQIDDAECIAMTLDPTDSRIYWVNEIGVWYMPFVGSDNNKFVTEPQLLPNALTNVTKLAVDIEPK